MKQSLGKSLSWSFVLASLVAFGTASCTPEERNFGNTGGAGGTGSSGSGMMCTPNMEQACYTGPVETKDVGTCKAGIAVCLPMGDGFSECGGEVVPVPENCLTVEDEACNGDDPSDCKTLDDGWLKTYGSPGFMQLIQDIAITSTGDIVVVGAFADMIDFGKGPMASTGSADIFVAKIDQLGNALWSKRFGDASPQLALAVAVDNTDAVYVGGSMAGSVDFEGTLLTSAGGDDAFLAKFESDGKFVWAHNYGDTAKQAIRQLEVSKANVIIAAGEFAGTIDFMGAKETAIGGTDVFLARFDTSGFVAGSTRFGGMLTDTVRGLALNSVDEIYLTGGFEGSADFNNQKSVTSTGSRDAYIAALKSSFSVLEVLGFGYANGPTTYQEGYDVAIAPNDDVFLTGGFVEGLELPGQFLPNADPMARSLFLARFKPQIAGLLTSQIYGGIAGTVPEGRLAVDAKANQLVIAGSYTGDMDFGGGKMSAVAQQDPYFVKLTFDGIQVAARTLPNDPVPSDTGNFIGSLALLPSGDVIIGGFERIPISTGKTIVGEPDPKDGNALLGRFLH